MSNGAAAAAAQIANAIKASGVLVHLETEDFKSILNEVENALVVCSEPTFFSRRYKYLFGYKGLAFYTASKEPVSLPGHSRAIRARNIWIPG